MKLIIEANGQRRLINGPFRIYGDAQSLILLRQAIDNALNDGISYGWVDVGDKTVTPDTTLYPWDAKAGEKPVLPWANKEVV